MPNTELTVELITEEVRSELGGSALEVELDQKDIEVAIKKTLREYNRYLAFQGRKKIAITTSQKKYRIDDSIPDLIGIVDVEFITRRIDPAGVDPFDPYVTALTGPNYGDETFADVMQRRMYTEDAQRIISSEPDWTAQWEDVDGEQQYFLYVDVWRNTIECGFRYNQNYRNTETGPRSRLAIPAHDTDWFLKYTAAQLKLVLARHRGKFGGITNPDGATDPFDSDTLREEADEELAALLADIKQRKRPYLPVIE